jgi:hypothetical protein
VDLVVDDHVRQLYGQAGGDWNSVAHQFAYDIDAAMKARRGLPSTPAYRPRTGPGVGTTGMPTGQPVNALGQLQRGTTAGGGAQQGGTVFPGGRPTGPMGHGVGTTGMPTGPGASDLEPLASQIVAGMGQILGRAPGISAAVAGGGVVGDNTPIFTGGQTVEQIDPAARAEEEIRRTRPGEVYEYGLMNVMQAFDQIIGGGR